MRVAVYANASARIGEGHAVRCLQLLDVLGVSHVVWFHHALTLRIESLFDTARFTIEQVELAEDKVEETLSRSLPANIDVVIVDDYTIDMSHRLTDVLLLAFDDLANRPIAADILIDANPLRSEADYGALIDPACTCLVGAKYLMLEEALFSSAPLKAHHQGHIFMGATDPMGLTLTCMKYLSELLPDWCWEVVVTGQTPELEEIKYYAKQSERFQINYEPPSLAAGLKKALLAIGAPGIATWQRMAAGCTVVLTATHHNQVEILQSLDNKGAIHYLGLGLDKDRVQQVLRHALCLEEQTPKPVYVFDQYGAQRIKAKILTCLAMRKGDA